jgi:hypothetical protein
MGDAPAHDAGADHGNRADFGHSFLFVFLAGRFQVLQHALIAGFGFADIFAEAGASSLVIAGMLALIRRRVVAMSSM